MSISANEPSLESWVEVDPDSHFPIQNLPFGVFRRNDSPERCGVAIGDKVVDLAVLQDKGYFDGLRLPKGIFANSVLNEFMRLGRARTGEVRNRISELLNKENEELKKNMNTDQFLIPMEDVEMVMPVHIGDYTDFYSSEYHAFNVGCMFRDPKNALLPNWKHLPVGYHGRASSIVISGTPIIRPKGQMKPDDLAYPVFGPTRLLDFELEMAFITCTETALGSTIPVDEAEDHIFGMVLFNDWSARDIQKWEYVPLGPFLAKNFASSISPWIVTMDALEPFRIKAPVQDPEVLPYLKCAHLTNFDIDLEVSIKPDQGEELKVTHSNSRHLYWTLSQQLAHHTINGCNIRVGDLFASGTISGPEPGTYGSMLEIAWKGTKPIRMTDGSERKFILDGDAVIMKGYAEKNGRRIGFGEVTNQILPSK